MLSSRLLFLKKIQKLAGLEILALNALGAHVQRKKQGTEKAFLLPWCEHVTHGSASCVRGLQVLALEFDWETVFT